MKFNPKRIGTVGYNPNGLIDFVLTSMNLKNDAALARASMIPPPRISKVRSSAAELSDGILLRLHDVSGIPVKNLRDVLETRTA